MPRPPNWRCVSFIPQITYFKPAGVPVSRLEEICLSVEEAGLVEALAGGIGVGAEVEAIPIPSAASTPGYQDGGGQHPMPTSMRQPFLIWDMVTRIMVPTTHPIPLTDIGSH